MLNPPTVLQDCVSSHHLLIWEDFFSADLPFGWAAYKEGSSEVVKIALDLSRPALFPCDHDLVTSRNVV